MGQHHRLCRSNATSYIAATLQVIFRQCNMNGAHKIPSNFKGLKGLKDFYKLNGFWGFDRFEGPKGSKVVDRVVAMLQVILGFSKN